MSDHCSPEDRLRSLGIELPTAPTPLAAYVPTVRTGDLLYMSGQVPVRNGRPLATGTVPDPVDLPTAQRCARQCGINALAALRAELGSLDRVRRVVRLGCYVACGAGYADQPAVANGASELMIEVFGEAGRHARAAVGCSSLPLNVPVEIEFVFEVRD